MRLPFLWIGGAFGAGIVLAQLWAMPPLVWLALSVAALLSGFALLRWQALWPAWFVGLWCWLLLGSLAATLEPLAVPPDHVTRLSEAGLLPTDTPLRWRGRLRSDPVPLPWGLRYEIDLDEVELAGTPRTITGGLRMSYFRNPQSPEPEPVVRAGDRVEAMVRARPQRNFLNPGAFDARAHLARQGIHLTATLRSTELLQKVSEAPPGLAHRLARARGWLLARTESLFAHEPERAAVLRAMLLGDRSFLDHDLAEQFQRTAVYHVLVVSGMHVAALAVFLFWLGRSLRLPRWATVALTLLALAAFVGVVEDQPPVLRAGLMAAVTLCAMLLFRHVELLNTIALAAVLILVARPAALFDPSFQLSFLAAGMIGALALPWIERSSGPYRHALAHLGDVTRDPAHAPRVAQFRLDARDAAGWLASRLPSPQERAMAAARGLLAGSCAVAFRTWEIFLVSLAVQIGMLPLMAWYFHRVSLAGLPANIPASVLAAVIVPAGFLALGLASLWTALGWLGSTVAGALTSVLLASVEWFSRSDWSTWRVPEPPAWLVAAYFVALGVVAVACRTVRAQGELSSARVRWQSRVAAGALAALALLVATYPFSPRTERGELEISALDVGQGDALFLAFPDGRTMLIDGGGLFAASRVGGFRTGLDVGEQVVSPYLWQRGLKRLDVVALTHAHQDHLDGLHAVLENFDVRELWVGRDVDAPAYRRLLETARARGIRMISRRRGDILAFGEVSGLTLWPEGGDGVAPTGSNNDSLVLRLDFGRTSVLLPGDIEKAVEAELVARDDPLDTDFLKVPHHGSRTSTTAEFLRAVTPQVAAVSLAENNPFGHPHPEVLERLEVAGVRVLRTDRDGAVTFTSDGKTAQVRTHRATVPLKASDLVR